MVVRVALPPTLMLLTPMPVPWHLKQVGRWLVMELPPELKAEVPKEALAWF